MPADQSERANKNALAHVDSFQVAHKGLFRTPVLTLYGVLPNPAYSIKHIARETSGDTVTVKPLLQHDADKVVIQIQVRYTETIKLPRRAQIVIIESHHQTMQAAIE